MSRPFGWVGKILWINLSDRTTRTLDTLDYGPRFIGGRGIAERLAWEFIRPGVGALDPGNLLMIFTGPLTGTTAPFSGRTTIAGLSPHGWPHEWMSRASLGGHWGPSLKYAGYDGVVFEGKSDQPVAIFIDEGQVRFLDARHVWGMGSIGAQKQLMDEIGHNVRILAIGQAGENLCRIATINSETESSAGGGGFGAVMGSKNLKAVAVRGSGPIYIAEPELFMQRCKAVVEDARTGAPWADSSLSEERVAKYKQRWQACTQQCAVRCGGGCRYYGEIVAPTTGEKLAGQFHCVSNIFPGIKGIYYDWNIGFEAGFEMRHLSDDYGLNQWEIILGLVPWLRECLAAGLVHEFNGRPIDFDSPQFWAYFMRAIATREGMGDALAEGGLRAAELLGFGKELAAPLYAGWGSAGHWDGHGDRANRLVYPFWIAPALQWAIDVRDPFSSSHGYTAMVMHWSKFLHEEKGIDWETIKAAGRMLYGTDKPVDPLSDYEDKEYAAVWHGNRSVLKDSITIDDNMFPRILSVAAEDGIARAGGMRGIDFEYHLYTAATGQQISLEEMDQACDRIVTQFRSFQVRHYGRQRSDDETIIPYFERPEWWQSPLRDRKMGLDREKFLPTLERFYRLRGWDAASGRPCAGTLRRLGLADVADELIAAGLIAQEE